MSSLNSIYTSKSGYKNKMKYMLPTGLLAVTIRSNLMDIPNFDKISLPNLNKNHVCSWLACLWCNPNIWHSYSTIRSHNRLVHNKLIPQTCNPGTHMMAQWGYHVWRVWWLHVSTFLLHRLTVTDSDGIDNSTFANVTVIKGENL